MIFMSILPFEEETRMASRTLCRIVWVPSGIALVSAVAAFALKPQAPPPPGGLMTFTSSDKTLVVSHPANWMSQSMSIGGTSVEVTYRPTRDVMVRFGTDLQGSLMADISRATGSMGGSGDAGGLPPELTNQLGMRQERRKTPLETVHETQQAMLAKELEQYQEGATTHTQLAGMEALATDFSCQTTSLFTKRPLVGRRFTALSNDRRVTAIYYLPKESEANLGPTIQKMVKSLRISQQGG
jgi:hypothetical protein